MKAIDTKTSLENLMEEVLKRDPVEPGSIRHTYALISTPRSGSNMFVEKLKNTGLMGNPMEWFNIRYIRAYQAVTGMEKINFGPYLQEIMRQTASENGVFGVNYHVDQYLYLQKRKIDIFKFIKFDKSYMIERRNKLAQAYSLSKARATDIWSSRIPLKPGDQEKIDNITNSSILSELRTLAAWTETCNRQLAHLVEQTFVYEDVVRDTEGKCFHQILGDFGLKSPEGHVFETRLERQSNKQDQKRIAALEKFILGN